MIRQLRPITVFSLSTVPRLMVTNSRIVVLSPMITCEYSPWNFRSCGMAAITAPGKDPAIFSDPCPFHNSYIRTDPGTITNLNILVNNSEGINLYIGCQTGIWVNISMGMNHLIKSLPRSVRGRPGKVNR